MKKRIILILSVIGLSFFLFGCSTVITPEEYKKATAFCSSYGGLQSMKTDAYLNPFPAIYYHCGNGTVMDSESLITDIKKNKP